MPDLDMQLKMTQTKVKAMLDRIISIEGHPKVLYKASRHIIEAGGKRLRPFIVLKACEIVGGREEAAMPVAASLELLHTFTLIHDDVMDRAKTRRGVPAVHVLWKEPMAITAGDLVFAKVFDAVLDYTARKWISPEQVLRTLSIITQATITVCEGQAKDISNEKRRAVTEEDYFETVHWKTASLYKAAAETGAVIGGGTETQIELLGQFAYNAGVAFQIRDDELGLVGDETVLKKPVGDDLRQGKQTILVIYALKHANLKQRRIILKTLGNRKATINQLKETANLIYSLGAGDYANKKAMEFIIRAKEKLAPFPESQAKRALLELADFFVIRKH